VRERRVAARGITPLSAAPEVTPMRPHPSTLLVLAGTLLIGARAEAATELPGTIAAYTSQNGAAQHILIAGGRDVR
jgi:hypothetical protein